MRAGPLVGRLTEFRRSVKPRTPAPDLVPEQYGRRWAVARGGLLSTAGHVISMNSPISAPPACRRPEHPLANVTSTLKIVGIDHCVAAERRLRTACASAFVELTRLLGRLCGS